MATPYTPRLQPEEAEMSFAKSDGQAVDLMVLDVVMPGTNRTELAARLTRKNSRMKVPFMSGYIDDAYRARGY